MRLNQFIFLLASTVFLGALTGWAIATAGIGVHIAWYAGLVVGAFLATTSLMGFWAYLTLNFIARITLPKRVWRWLQVLITLLVLYDMLWGRYRLDVARHSHAHAPYLSFFIQGMWPFCVALAAALWKRKLSGKGSYLPTVFFLYVFTVLDWLLVIKSAVPAAIINVTGIIMMVCNVYLILIFGKLLTPRTDSPGNDAERHGGRQTASGQPLPAPWPAGASK